MKKYGIFFLILFLLWPQTAFPLTIAQEKEMGRKFFIEVKRQLPIISDPVLNRYYNELGQYLVNHLEERHFNYHFYLIDNPTLNAFSGPAGYVFMYRGLFLIFDTEDELAAVTAHEIAHVKCRHIAKRLTRGKKIGLATLVAILAGALLASEGEATSAITTTSMAASMAISLKYSRQDEEEADRHGLDLLLKAGYEGKAMVSAFRKLARFSLESPGRIPAYLKTHPDIGIRIVYISNTLKHLAHKSTAIPRPRFHLMQARLRALYTDKEAAKNFFKQKLCENKKEPSNYYGLALCLMQERNWQKAVEYLKKALKLEPNETLFLRELGICYTEIGKFKEAIDYLKKVPIDLEVAFHLGRAYKELGKKEEAIKIWNKTIEMFSKKEILNISYLSRLYYALAQCYAENKQMDWAHYYLGCYFESKAKSKQAHYHYNKALTLTHDKKLKTKIKKK